MFKRLILGEYAAATAIVAFAVTAAIFFWFVWRAAHMQRSQSDRFANLPFNSDSDAARHDPSV